VFCRSLKKIEGGRGDAGVMKTGHGQRKNGGRRGGGECGVWDASYIWVKRRGDWFRTEPPFRVQKMSAQECGRIEGGAGSEKHIAGGDSNTAAEHHGLEPTDTIINLGVG